MQGLRRKAPLRTLKKRQKIPVLILDERDYRPFTEVPASPAANSNYTSGGIDCNAVVQKSPFGPNATYEDLVTAVDKRFDKTLNRQIN